ncbi:hypothetical protein [Metabacillus fastidiosus]|uniref:hypothetical protein n=1 Tax=Metabacillus fastidiosus TaxID=1458 RepID=UPI002E1A586B|nr:hypothetical protein [Metabacillus fastidiosus]
MCYPIEKFNPLENQFCFRLGEYDCYGLRKGTCSLYLSEEEARTIQAEEGNQFRDSNVMFCRNLAKSLLKDDYFNNPDFQKEPFAIVVHPRGCGHFVFTDGQHRTCIAKHLNVNSIFVKMDSSPKNNETKCSACMSGKYSACLPKKEKISFKDKIRAKLRGKAVNENKQENKKEIPLEFIDEEYMEFRKESLFL